MTIRTVKASQDHEVAYHDLVALVRKYSDTLTGVEMLAVAANMLGKLIAMQDQRTVSPARAMEIVLYNMKTGNDQVTKELGRTVGSA